MAAKTLIDSHLTGPGCSTQCFSFYTYAEDGTHSRENITDWALEQFRTHYHSPSISKWDIFHYIYAVLHHLEYREHYAANLRRELPRIPFASRTTCHPEQSEGPLQSASATSAADKSIDPSARKERGPQDDKGIFRAFVAAGQRLAKSTSATNSSRNIGSPKQRRLAKSSTTASLR
jgi:hypothetical protein